MIESTAKRAPSTTAAGGRLAAVLASAVEQLHDDDVVVRRVAAETLGALGPEAAPVLDVMIERSVVDPHAPVRYALLWALEQVPWVDLDAVPTFVKVLDDPDFVAQARAAWAISKVGPDAVEAVPDLVRVASDATRWVDPRWSAVVSLERLGPVAREAARGLEPILGDERADMREAVARTMCVIAPGEEWVIDCVLPCVDDPHQHVRESTAAGFAAAGLARPDVRSALEGLLLDQWPAVRRAARDALVALFGAASEVAPPPTDPEHERSVQAFAEFCRERLADDDDRRRGGGAYGAGTLGPYADSLLDVLLPLYATDRNLDVRWSAAWAFGRLAERGAGTVPALVRGLRLDLDPDVRAMTAWSLGELARDHGDWADVAVAALARALGDHDSLVREEASAALGRIGAPAAAALPALAVAATDRHRLVREKSRAAITAIAARSAHASAR